MSGNNVAMRLCAVVLGLSAVSQTAQADGWFR